ncbi:hypothetical protein JL09_g1924 [Pichia kudriavzevii]|uniref:Zn(2)-C6 fungal-type domain-containing protein n=1 Tax=Pichia kudriavzevii TaxID=4909 RepID=A0A099P3Y5_PICKU|nr:hypothetical protein JL09_g1924 [Pichia kudriavzevii]
MSQSSPDAMDGPRKKRNYSRKGCIPCKQKKWKCDEQKPSCLNCLKNNRECSYRQILKFDDNRSFTLKGSRLANFKNVHVVEKSVKSELGKKQDGQHKFSKLNVIPVSKPSDDPFNYKIPRVVQNSDDVDENIINPLEFFSSTNTDVDPDKVQPSVPQMDKSPGIISQSDMENTLFDGASNLITDLNGLINSFQMDFSSLDFENQFKHYSGVDIEKKQQHHHHYHHHQQQQQDNSSNFHQTFTPSLSQIRFEGISPTNYSVESLETNYSRVTSANSLASQNNLIPDVHTSSQTIRQISAGKTDEKIHDVEGGLLEAMGKGGREDSNESGRVNVEKEDDDEEEEEDDDDQYSSNTPYIETLTKSLEDYGTPKHIPEIESPADSPLGYNTLVSNYSLKSGLARLNVDHLKAFPPPNKDILKPFDYIEIMNKTLTDADIEFIANFFSWSLDSVHTEYLKVFITHIHLNIIPFSTNYTQNAYVKIFLQQAKQSPHLLFAILAIAARYEVYQIEQHPEIHQYEEKLNYHRTYRTYYISSCLKALESILHSRQTTLDNIESLLLTIQVLASDFSGHKGSQWRTHLHGAKDLLIKYCRYRPLSLELTIVWLWFHSMEVLAALTSPYGGTVHDFDELDEFLSVLCPQMPQYMKDLGRAHEIFRGESKLLKPGKLTYALRYMGILVDSNKNSVDSRFNMYLGYDETLLEAFNALIYAIECIRGRESEAKLSDTFQRYEGKIMNVSGKSLNSDFLLSLFSLIKKARNFQYINNQPPYIVPLGMGSHPFEIMEDLEDNGENANSRLKDVLISTYIHPCKAHRSNDETVDGGVKMRGRSTQHPTELRKEVFFSWIDLAQQLNTDAAFLRLLTLHKGICEYGMSIKSSLVQEVVGRMIMGLYGLVRFKEDVAEDIDSDSKLKELNDRYQIREYKQDNELNEKSLKGLADWPSFQFDKYLNYQFDNRLVMVQWPLYVCGLCCIEPKQKIIIECCFDGLVGLGVGSAELSFKKLRKIWKLQNLGKFDFERYNLFAYGFDDDEEDDYVPFM